MDRAVALIDRGAMFEAARHALGLWRWFARPDEAHSEAIGSAAAALSAIQQASPLLGAALGVRAWLDRDGERPPLRAALAGYWQRRGLLRLACPLLTGAKALTGGTPWEVEPWTIHFLAAWRRRRKLAPSSCVCWRDALLHGSTSGRRQAPAATFRGGERTPAGQARASGLARRQQ
jgi:hypothetical protein